MTSPIIIIIIIVSKQQTQNLDRKIKRWCHKTRRRDLTQVDQEVPFYRVLRILKVVEILTYGWGKEKEGEEELRFHKNIRGRRKSSFPLSSPLWTEYSFPRLRPQPPPSPSWSSRLSDEISQPSLSDLFLWYFEDLSESGTLFVRCLTNVIILYFSNLKLF